MERSQCMLSYNSTCKFNTGGDRNAACTIQGAGGRRVVFYIYIRERVPVGEYGHIIHQNAGNREPVDLVRKKKWVSPENLRLVLTGRYCITTALNALVILTRFVIMNFTP